MTPRTFATELERCKKEGLYRTLRRVDGGQGPSLFLEGNEVLNLSSNNYLGLANHPAVCLAAKAAIDRYGCGSAASRLISGNMALHEQLEEKIAALKRTEAALVFNSGFQANVGVIPALVGKDDVVFSDELNHASIIDGCRLARAETVVYRHGDPDSLETALKDTAQGKQKLIITETLFSMDGDEAPVAEIVELAERYGALTMVDEAHATGVAGPNGAGIVAKLGLTDRVPVQMGTLGKALGGFGAYVAGSRKLREFLINRCRSFVFTTALPPPVLGAAIAAVELLHSEPQRRLALWHNARAMKEGLRKLGFSPGRSESQILPLILGESEQTMEFSQQLLRKGVFVQGIRPPTVAPGTSRLRITLMATHTHAHLHQGLQAFDEVKNEMGMQL